MRKFRMLSILSVTVSVLFWNSCKSKEEDPIINFNAPKVVQLSSSSTGEVELGKQFTFTFSTSVGDGLLVNLKILSDGEFLSTNRFTLNDVVLPELSSYEIPENEKNGQTYVLVIDAMGTVGEETISIKLYDENDKVGGVNFKMTTEEGLVGAIDAKEIILGTPTDDGTGLAFYNVSSHTSYSFLDVTTVVEPSIDFGYFYGSEAKIISSSVYYVANNDAGTDWSTANETRFTSITSAQFHDATVTSLAEISFETSATVIAPLQVNSLFAFKTTGGKIGVIKVIALSAGFSATDNITLSIKTAE